MPRLRHLGFPDAADGDELFRDLVLARVIKPTSKLDALRVLAEAGIAPTSYATLKRRLPVYAEPVVAARAGFGLREACGARAGIAGALRLGIAMRVAVMGATGRIGRYTVDALTRSGHETVPISRSTGVDAYTGAGLDEALAGVGVVVDVSNTRSQDEAEIVDFFGTVTRNLLDAEDRASVGHHVLLSIVGIDHDQHLPHYVGKREQERRVTAGPIPWSVVRSTQFHDFAAMVVSRALQDGTATIAPLLVQPIAQQEVGQMLADVATGTPLGRPIDIAGPETQDLVDMARRTFAERGEQVRLVPTWRGLYDTAMAGEVLLPRDGARLGSVTFEDWLAAGAR